MPAPAPVSTRTGARRSSPPTGRRSRSMPDISPARCSTGMNARLPASRSASSNAAFPTWLPPIGLRPHVFTTDAATGWASAPETFPKPCCCLASSRSRGSAITAGYGRLGTGCLAPSRSTTIVRTHDHRSPSSCPPRLPLDQETLTCAGRYHLTTRRLRSRMEGEAVRIRV